MYKKLLQYLNFAVITYYLFFVLSFVCPLYSVLSLRPVKAHEYWSVACTKSLRIVNKFLPQSKKL